MTTDSQMREARILALEEAQQALGRCDTIRSADLLNRIINSHEGREHSPSQRCAIQDILGAIEAVLQGNRYEPHDDDCRTLHERQPPPAQL